MLYTHSYTDGGGCHARCRPAHQEQFGVQYLAQGQLVKPRKWRKPADLLFNVSTQRIYRRTDKGLVYSGRDPATSHICFTACCYTAEGYYYRGTVITVKIGYQRTHVQWFDVWARLLQHSERHPSLLLTRHCSRSRFSFLTALKSDNKSSSYLSRRYQHAGRVENLIWK